MSGVDDDSFENYIETTVDPGPWLNVATTLFCVICTLFLPCLVTLGRRYEKYRLENKNGTIPIERTQPTQTHKDMEDAITNEQGEIKSWYSPGHENEVNSGTEEVTEPSILTRRSNAITGELSGGDASVPLDIRGIVSSMEKQWSSELKELKVGEFAESSSSSSSSASEILDDMKEELAVLEMHSVTSPSQDCNAMVDTGSLESNEDGNEYDIENTRESSWHKAHEHKLGTNPCHEKPIQALCDKLLLPPYPDQSGASEHYNFYDAVLDTGAGMRNRDTAMRRYQLKLHEENRKPHHSKHSTSSSGEEVSDFDDCHHWHANSDLSDEEVWDHLEQKITYRKVLETNHVPMEGEDIDLLYGEKAWWKPSSVAAGFDKLLDIMEWDREMKRILSLATPISLESIAQGLFEVVRVALVARFIGSEAVGAYTIVIMLLELTHEFFGGFSLSCASLCSHAVGSKNYFLAGEYVQISCICFSICMIPNVLFWMFLTDDIVRLFGYNEETVEMAQSYVVYYVISLWIFGLDDAYGALLSVIDHERFYTSMSILREIVATSIVAGLVTTRPTSLATVGLVELCTNALAFGLILVISNVSGWMKRYHNGLFKLKKWDVLATKTVVKTAVPLGVGQLLQFGEWEVLTVFVAALGTAELTTWGIIGSLWDTLELLTEGFGDAAEIRTGFHLGAAQPARAKASSYKSMVVSTICATMFTSLLWVLGEDLATWLTPDPTLQRLIIDVLPLIGVGNIALNGGTVSWAVVGSQGRYPLATFLAFVFSWGVTLPLAAILVYGLNINLQGPVAAVVVGYSVSGTCLQYVLIRSDWDRLSRMIVERNGGIVSDSSSGSSSSSSSSSLSSDDLVVSSSKRSLLSSASSSSSSNDTNDESSGEAALSLSSDSSGSLWA